MEAVAVAAGLEIAAETGNAGELGVGPLHQELVHHAPLDPVQWLQRRIATVPVGHGQLAPRAQHAQQLIGIALLVGHVGPGLHAPDRIEAGIRQLQG